MLIIEDGNLVVEVNGREEVKESRKLPVERQTQKMEN